MAKPDAGDVGAADFAALIEAAYHPGGSDADWLTRIVACAQPGLDRGRGVVGCLFIPGADGAAAVTAVVGVGALPAQPETVAAAFLPALVGRAGGASATAAICGKARGACDGDTRECSGVVATDDPDGRRARAGCALLAPLPRAAGLSRDAAAIWSRVAQHLGAALRLRRAVPHDQTVWRGLLSGRWALVDHFDAGGRRFIIARGRVAPAARVPPARLTDRERDACARAAAGCANKVIAAELGVAVSTVGMLLLRAARKLRCRSREELIRAFRFLEERWDQNASAPAQVRPDDGSPTNGSAAG
jgi:DNA-binding CsgD family transcriptional regulator